MATRLYLTSRPHGTILLGPPLGDWSPGDSSRANRGPYHWSFVLAETTTSGGVNANGTQQTISASITKTPAQPLYSNYRWVSKPLSGAGGTISGTLTLTFKVQRTFSTGGTTAQGRCFAYVTVGDSLTLRSVLIPNTTHGTLWTATLTWRELAFALSAGAWLPGDRIVIEFGAVCSFGGSDDNSYRIAYGTTNSSDVPRADAVNGSTADAAAWAEFSDTLTFDPDPPAPLNDACVDAVVIPSVPHTTALVDGTSAATTLKELWWTWTCGASGRYILSTWGSNYAIQLRVYTGTCGGLVGVAGVYGTLFRQRVAWIGRAQAAFEFDALAGVTYFFRASSMPVGAGGDAGLHALNSAGACRLNLYPYQPPAHGDLFVDCLHIVCFRAGVPINLMQDFYGFTPTGNAIDTTHRPLDNLNGGVHTADRLYVCLFNFGLVEILDLATLNVGQMEIDYLDNVFDAPAVQGEHLSSVVFDRAGNLWLGWYGDNYAVIDQLATVPTADPAMVDATHGDNQAGAPWPPAATYGFAYQDGGTDFVEIDTTQAVAWYTSGGDQIKRFNVVSLTQLGDFATLPAPVGPRPGARSVRLLPPGDGSAGLLVAYGDRVLRLSSGGTVIQTYIPAETDRAQDLDKLELNADGSAFYVSDQYSAHIFGFATASGAQLSTLDTRLPPGQLCGFVVYGGYRAGDTPSTPVPPGAPGCPVDFPVDPAGTGACVPPAGISGV